MSALDGLTMQLSVSCPSCHQVVHIQGVEPRPLCQACLDPVELPPSEWVDWFGPKVTLEALECDEGMANTSNELSGLQAKVAMGHRKPRCQKCKTDIAMDQLPQYAAAGGFTCSCGEAISVREAPPFAMAFMPAAKYLVHEGPLDGDGLPAAASPVMMSCNACNGSLSVDGTSRAVVCRFCSASNYLPDGLWLRLHPPRKVRTFFAVIDTSQAAKRALLREARPEIAAMDPTASPEYLAQMARSGDWEVRRSVARNQSATPEVLRVLAKDSDSDVRRAVAENPNAPAELLVDSDDWEVRRSVARNPNVPPDVLARLVDDSDSDVRGSVAGNPNCPPEVLKRFCTDSSYDIRQKVVSNPSLTPQMMMPWLAFESDSDVLKAASKRQDLPADLIAAWARSGSYSARRAAAMCPATPPALLLRLASDEDDDVLKALVMRDDLDGPTVLALAASSDQRISAFALSHASYAPAVSARRKRRLIIAAVLVAMLGCAGGAALVVAVAIVVGQALLAAAS